MIPSLPQHPLARLLQHGYAAAFYLFLFLPLLVVLLFAFNNADYPAPPWHGATLDWFFANGEHGRTGLFHDDELLTSIVNSLIVAGWVAVLSVVVGTCNAFLLERMAFRGKRVFSLAILLPLVIPGVILGISILAFASKIALLAEDLWGWELDFLRPGLPLVVFGQFSYIVTIATLTIAARLKRFDRSLEEAAFNLGASRTATFWTITLPYLRPVLFGSFAVAFLLSFENFNTTLMLAGSEPPLTILMYGRMRNGATPVLNAISLALMLTSALLALAMMRRKRERH
jgi:spermidine/putrescine transport system permease protein